MIETIQWQYDPQELLLWEKFDRHGHGFPQSKHLKYCKFESELISCERPQYFAEAWVCRRFYNQGCEVFHERYWLHNFSYQGRQTYSNPRLREILGAATCEAIESEATKLTRFGNPDVIAYDPNLDRLHLFEIKLEKPSGYRDRLKPHQIESLEMLKRLIPTGQIAIVELAHRTGNE